MRTQGTLLLPLVMGVAAGHSASAAEVRVVVHTASITNTMRGGMGASWHAIEEPFPTYNGIGGNPPFEDKAAWEQVYRHAEWLGMDWVRVEITQLMYEPQRNKFVWDGRDSKGNTVSAGVYFARLQAGNVDATAKMVLVKGGNLRSTNDDLRIIEALTPSRDMIYRVLFLVFLFLLCALCGKHIFFFVYLSGCPVQ